MTTEIRLPARSSGIGAEDFQRDLGRYWRHVRRAGGLPIAQTGWIYKTAFKTLLAALNDTSGPTEEAGHGRLHFIRAALTALGALSVNDNGDLTVVEGAAYLSLPLPVRVRMLFELWRDSPFWYELNRIATPHFREERPPEPPPEMARGRATALRLLGESVREAGRWVSFDRYADHVKRVDVGFLLRRSTDRRGYAGRFQHLYHPLGNTPYVSANNAYGITFEVRDPEKAWERVERLALAAMLAGPLRWMGLADIGTLRDDNALPNHADGVPVDALRLSPAGAWLLANGPEPDFTESGGRVVVQPNFSILAIEPMADAVLIDLDHFAETRGGDRAALYELTRSSVYHGQRAGWTAARIIAFLEGHQGAPLPVNVRRSLEEWQQQHERITFVRGARLLQYADDEARAGARESLGATSLRMVSDRFDLVTTAQPLDTLVNTLREAGWVPQVSREQEDDRAGVVHVNADGTLTLNQPVISLEALADLDLLAEPEGEGYTLSAAHVRAAMGRGVLAEQAVATLAHLADGPLPEGVVDALHGWTSFYGEATAREMIALTFSHLDVMEHALADPELARLLQAIPGATLPIVLIERRNFARARAALIARGLALSGDPVKADNA